MINRKTINRFLPWIGFFGVIFLIVLLTVPAKAHAIENLVVTIDESPDLKKIWKYFLNAVNGFGLLIIILVAFAEILRINVNTYGFKKILPALIMAILAANFSYLICQVLIDTANIAITYVMGGGNSVEQFDKLTQGLFDNKWDTNNWFNPGLLNPLMAIGFIIIFAILTFLFIIRIFMLYFLVVIAPIAFMAMVLPQTKSLFNQWWSTMLKWTYAPVMSFLFLWLGVLFINMLGDNPDIFVFKIIIGCAAGYFAVTAPFKLGGPMQAWSNLGKKAWGATGGKAIKGAGWAAGGGFQSYMAYRNQLKAAKAGAMGLKEKEAKYKAKASRWTAANPRAWRDAIKGRMDATSKAIEGAPKKTNFYNNLLGPGAAVQAGYDANVEDYRGATAEAIGHATGKSVKKIWGKMNSRMRQRFENEATATENQQEARSLGYDLTTADGQRGYAQYRFLNYVRTTNPNNIALVLKNSGLSNFELGDLKAQSSVFMQKMNSRFRTEARREFDTGYNAAPPVGPSTGPTPAPPVGGGAGGGNPAPPVGGRGSGGNPPPFGGQASGQPTVNNNYPNPTPPPRRTKADPVGGNIFTRYGRQKTANQAAQAQAQLDYDGAVEYINQRKNADARAVSEAIFKKAGVKQSDMTQKLHDFAKNPNMSFEDFRSTFAVSMDKLGGKEREMVKNAFNEIRTGKPVVPPVPPPVHNPFFHDKTAEAAQSAAAARQSQSDISRLMGSEAAEKISRTAQYGNKSFKDTISEHRAEFGKLDQSARQAVEKSFNQMRSARHKQMEAAVNDELQGASKEVQDTQNALKVLEHSKDGQAEIKQHLGEASALLNKQNRTAAENSRLHMLVEPHMKMSGEITADNEHLLRSAVNSALNGFNEFDKAKVDPIKGEGIKSYYKRTNQTDRYNEVSNAEVAASMRVATGTALNPTNLPANVQNAPVIQATSLNAPSSGSAAAANGGFHSGGGEHLDRPIDDLAHSVNQLASHIAEQKNMPHQNFTPQEVRAGIIHTANEVPSIKVDNSSLGDLLKNPDFQKRFADNISRAIVARSPQMKMKTEAPTIKMAQTIVNNTNTSNTTNNAGATNMTNNNVTNNNRGGQDSKIALSPGAQFQADKAGRNQKPPSPPPPPPPARSI